MKKGISQEALKLIACMTMLIDHMAFRLISPVYSAMSAAGTATLPELKVLFNFYLLCRCIGRTALPIFAFLLVEGFHTTRSRKKYACRLAIGALLAEIPYNLLVSGKVICQYQSVMLTLLLGICTLQVMEKCRSLAWKPVAVIPFAVAAELLAVDYGWAGIVLIALFELSRQMDAPNLVRTGGMIVLFHAMSSQVLRIGNFSLPIQVVGVLSMLFIANYGGYKCTDSKAVQWMFYLFYPVHLFVLWAIWFLIFVGIPG